MSAHFVCPPEHPHARTHTCYRWHGCRCSSCEARAGATRVRHAARLVPAARVLQHLEQLRATGAKRGQIAAAAGVEAQAISAFLARPPASTHHGFAAALLAVTPAAALAAPLGDRVPARGALRRLQALYALGWSFEAQATRAGVDVVELRRLLAGRRFVRPQLDAAIRRLHRDLWSIEPPANSPGRRRAIESRRRRARRLGYLPTLAWDDIDRDDAPPEVPPGDDDVDEVAVALALEGAAVPLRPREVAAIRKLRGSRRSRPVRIAA